MLATRLAFRGGYSTWYGYSNRHKSSVSVEKRIAGGGVGFWRGGVLRSCGKKFYTGRRGCN